MNLTSRFARLISWKPGSAKCERCHITLAPAEGKPKSFTDHKDIVHTVMATAQNVRFCSKYCRCLRNNDRKGMKYARRYPIPAHLKGASNAT